MKYELKKNLIGKYSVKFACPKCSSVLSSPLEQAGTNDNCPDCGAVFVVPAKEKLEQWQRQKEEQSRHAATLAEEKENQRLASKAECDRVESERRVAAAAARGEKNERERMESELKRELVDQQSKIADQASRLQPSKDRSSKPLRGRLS